MILVGEKAHAETPGGEVGEMGVPRLPGETAPSRSWLLPTPTSASPKGGLRVEKATRTDRGSQGQDQPPGDSARRRPLPAWRVLPRSPARPRPRRAPPGSEPALPGGVWPPGEGGQGGAGRAGEALRSWGPPPARRCPGLGRPRCPSRGASGGRRWVEMPAPRASPQPRGRRHRHAAAGARSLRGEADPPSPGCGRV